MDGRHHNKNECKKADCKRDECRKVECKKDDCKKREKKCKSSSSSSSSESCAKECVPRVVYEYCRKNQCSSLGLTYVVTGPNLDNPATYTCPEQIGQNINIAYTITNLGQLSLRGPIMLYNSLTGVNKVATKHLGAGQSVVVTTNHRITQADCQNSNISIVANAYVNLDNCVVLVSQPVSIVIGNGTVPETSTCCVALAQSLGAFEPRLAEIAATGSGQILINFLPTGGAQANARSLAAIGALNTLGPDFRTAIQGLVDAGCGGECCVATAEALLESQLGIASLIITAVSDPNIPDAALPTVLAGLAAANAAQNELILSLACL